MKKKNNVAIISSAIFFLGHEKVQKIYLIPKSPSRKMCWAKENIIKSKLYFKIVLNLLNQVNATFFEKYEEE